ncbi:MAG: (2Fe-2S)-binding protein [Rhodococcus sp. (in: high G+C Gram-positive bacteria)]
MHEFSVNGQTVSVDAPDDLALLWVLRDKLGVRGPKYGCGIGVCHACTSHLDGEEMLPCTTPVSEVEGREVTTIEGLAATAHSPDLDALHPVQQAWLEEDVAQCGYCQPGQIMAAVALLERTSNPTDEDIDRIENVCRCGTYFRIRQAIQRAVRLRDASE